MGNPAPTGHRLMLMMPPHWRGNRQGGTPKRRFLKVRAAKLMLTTYLLLNMLGSSAPVVTTPPVPMPASSRRQGTIVTVPSVGFALSVANAKQQLQIEPDDTARDAQIAGFVAAAHRFVEARIDRPLLRQSRRTHLFGFPSGRVWLGSGADLTVDAVHYFDAAGTEQLLATNQYFVDAVSQPAAIHAAGSWPATTTRPGAVTIDWTAGWANASAVPEDIVQALCLLVGHWFENREAVIVGTISGPVAFAVDALLEPYLDRAFL